VPGRGGIFSRALRAIQRVFTREEPPRPEPSRAPTSGYRPPEQRRQRDRQRARERDPYLFWWDRELRGRERTGYLNHRDIVNDIAEELDLDEDEKQELWRDYTHYMVAGKGPYLRKDERNPFWLKWGIDPDRFDWQGWRDAMGDSPIK
jgi:hypothetical protein